MTIPGSTAWLIASPRSDQPLSTISELIAAIGSAIRKVIRNAFCM
jgi:hypothetical protein